MEPHTGHGSVCGLEGRHDLGTLLVMLQQPCLKCLAVVRAWDVPGCMGTVSTYLFAKGGLSANGSQLWCTPQCISDILRDRQVRTDANRAALLGAPHQLHVSSGRVQHMC